MTTMSQGNKKITTRKIPSTDNKVLVRTGSLHFFKKYREPSIKFWSVPVPVRETVRKKEKSYHMSKRKKDCFLGEQSYFLINILSESKKRNPSTLLK